MATLSSLFNETWIIGPQDTTFYTRRWTPAQNGFKQRPKAGLLFLHGFIEHIGRYEHVFPTYASAGIDVLAFDGRGFGRTALGEHRDVSAKYGRTSWREQLADIEFMLAELKMSWGLDGPKIPVFLMGHSMGGALSLAYVSRPPDTPSRPSLESLLGLAGVIATSPLIQQTKPAPKWQVWLGGKVSSLPAGIGAGVEVPAAVNPGDLSHDPTVGEKYKQDPYVKFIGTTKGVSDMLAGGQSLLVHDYIYWPPTLPLLILHGTDDQVTSFAASHAFVNAVPATDKTFVPFEGGYHELHNEPDGVGQKLGHTIISWIGLRVGGISVVASGSDAKL